MACFITERVNFELALMAYRVQHWHGAGVFESARSGIRPARSTEVVAVFGRHLHWSCSFRHRLTTVGRGRRSFPVANVWNTLLSMSSHYH